MARGRCNRMRDVVDASCQRRWSSFPAFPQLCSRPRVADFERSKLSVWGWAPYAVCAHLAGGRENNRTSYGIGAEPQYSHRLASGQG
jgi:hypothetical protein